MNIFISYCHKNKEHLEAFLTHLSPLISQGSINCWYDGKNLAGSAYQDGIDNGQACSDIDCLMITPEYLASEACQKEIVKAIDAIPNGKLVVPIIVKDSLWKDDTRISRLLALPEDGKPVADFPRVENAWTQVCDGLKKLIFQNTYPEVTADFSTWQLETELSVILSSQTPLTLEELFAGFDFEVRDLSNGNVVAKTSCEDLFNSIQGKEPKIIISGGQQSGKTVALKKIYSLCVEKKVCLPVYLDVELSKGKINLQKAIQARIEEQYAQCQEKNLSRWPKILLIDNFYRALEKEQKGLIDAISEMEGVCGSIITVDDVYDLGVSESLVTARYQHYRIKPLGYKRRDELVCTWMHLAGKDPVLDSKYRDDISNKIEMVRQKAIMPAYPFFIYSVIASYEATTPLNNEITSQGHC